MLYLTFKGVIVKSFLACESLPTPTPITITVIKVRHCKHGYEDVHLTSVMQGCVYPLIEILLRVQLVTGIQQDLFKPPGQWGHVEETKGLGDERTSHISPAEKFCELKFLLIAQTKFRLSSVLLRLHKAYVSFQKSRHLKEWVDYRLWRSYPRSCPYVHMHDV